MYSNWLCHSVKLSLEKVQKSGNSCSKLLRNPGYVALNVNSQRVKVNRCFWKNDFLQTDRLGVYTKSEFLSVRLPIAQRT